MHHPIQMKPADSENRNGEYQALYITIYYRSKLFLLPTIEREREKKNCYDASVDSSLLSSSSLS